MSVGGDSQTVAKALQLGVGGYGGGGGGYKERKSTMYNYKKKRVELIRLGGAGAIKAWWCQPGYYLLPFYLFKMECKGKGKTREKGGRPRVEDGKV